MAARFDPSDGARLVSLVIGGVERLLPKTRARASKPALYWGCYAMVPWAGRIGGGRIPTQEGEVILAPNLPPSAIHGLGFDKAWDIETKTAGSVTARCELRGLGWPFGGWARQVLELNATSLSLELEIGGYLRPGPAGGGWHPWFTRPARGDLAIRLDSSRVLVVDRDLVPTGEVRPVTAIEDLRHAPALGDRRLDRVYVGATSPVVVSWPDLELEIEFAEELNTVVVYTPVEAVCVEPQTMWPNAPALASRGVGGTGIRTLRPGERLVARERWTWRTRA